LVVLCANCHRMTHRKRGVLLTVDELRGKINVEGARNWCKRLADAVPNQDQQRLTEPPPRPH
jgi:hypothetical protein